jgi:hypothetical protein
MRVRTILPTLLTTLLGAAACQPAEAPMAALTPQQLEEIQKDLLKEEPAPQYKINATFGDAIELIGYDISTPLVPGKPATFTWYWRAKKAVPANWQVFVHFDSERRPFRQNLDHHPVRGLYTTNRWKPGEIIRDVQEITLQPGYPAGPARPFIGLFQGDTRLNITAASDKTDDNRVRGPVVQILGADGKTAPEADPRPSYNVREVTGEQGKITVDGKLDEPIWKELSAMRLKPMGSAPALDTWARAYYTEDALIIGAYLADTHIWGTLTERDADTWTQEVLEVFLDTNGDSKDYLELQVTPANVIFDARFDVRLGRGQGTRPEQIDRARAWNLEGLQSAVSVDGTLNDEAQADRAWTVEIVLPFANIPGAGARPKVGDAWSLNLYRFDVPKPKQTLAYGWSTEPMGDFHQIDKFGKIVFADAQGKAPEAPSPVKLNQLPMIPNKAQLQIKERVPANGQDNASPFRINPAALRRHKLKLPPGSTPAPPASTSNTP